MYTSPSMDDYLDALQAGLTDDLMPALTTAKAQATAAMMLSVLQQLRQMLPVYATYLVEEHNGMITTLTSVADALGDAPGPEADRVRQRASTVGSRAPLPLPTLPEEVAAAHRELGSALRDCLWDLDVLQRAGDERATEALQRLRAHFGPRFGRDVATIMVGAGFLGRG